MTFSGSAPPSPWRPLRQSVFRWLWIANVASHLGSWLQSVGSSWMMTTLSASTVMVALVQVATSLPMFLLSLPGGALADVLDRRKLLLLTQGWMLASAAGLGLLTLAGVTTPWMLLLFTFLLGIGAAINGPAWQSVLPELVPWEDLPAAIALGSIGFNIARAIGPAIGGVLVATVGPAATFLLNAASFLGVLAVLYRWRRPEAASRQPAERILDAMSAGVRYVRHAPEVLAPIIRSTAFMLCGSSLWAVLPVVARVELGEGPAGYGLLLAAMGIGAVAGATVLPRLRHRLPADGVMAASTLVFAAALLALAWAPGLWLACGAMLAAGGSWLWLVSTLNVSLQTVVPSWVRGRALSVYMLFFFGSFSLGSALWGVVAERAGTAAALTASAVCTAAGLLATARWRLQAVK